MYIVYVGADSVRADSVRAPDGCSVIRNRSFNVLFIPQLVFTNAYKILFFLADSVCHF